MYLKSWIVVDGQAEDVERSRNRFKKKMQLIEVGTHGDQGRDENRGDRRNHFDIARKEGE